MSESVLGADGFVSQIQRWVVDADYQKAFVAKLVVLETSGSRTVSILLIYVVLSLEALP